MARPRNPRRRQRDRAENQADRQSDPQSRHAPAEAEAEAQPTGSPNTQWPMTFMTIGVRVSPTPRSTPVVTACVPSNS